MCYVVVTVVAFGLLSVANRSLAALTLSFSLLALAMWTFGHALWNGYASSIGTVVFGVYCRLIGYLI